MRFIDFVPPRETHGQDERRAPSRLLRDQERVGLFYFFPVGKGCDGSAGRISRAPAFVAGALDPAVVRYASLFNPMDRRLSIALPSMPFSATTHVLVVRELFWGSLSGAFLRIGARGASTRPGLTGGKYISG
ncbi:hypothetical protein GPA22_10850 [Aromatoleum toluvorans]|uniref:Uncharacterized protein n=1 Tax=Aromatoleum toluvorans TaxID=92002 RepID=A0ABX1Q1J3_9RHOO|nr:hypothetical protein [Aromatoleum toluvorans]NMG44226.1 hypothetical protein [Aromatoleum toluvorans]